ncbi:MAG: replication-relaxation family protein [Candidatus Limnocylindrales bacterium]
MIGTFRPAPRPDRQYGLDPGFLGTRDRAALRILNRADVATTAQLVRLVYHRRQTAQEHLSALYRAGWLERAVLPPESRGGAPLAFRLAARARRRLGYGPLTRSRAGTQLRHSLNIVETVAALTGLAIELPDRHPVQAWLPESITSDAKLPHVYPDSVVALQLSGGSAVVCLEIDQSTEHAPQIRDKLARYEPALRSRVGWHVLFVVETAARATYLARVARDQGVYLGLTGRAWAIVLGDLKAEGVAARAVSLTPGRGPRTLTSIIDDPRPRRCATPVGSDAWLELLASGGGEDLHEALV